MRISGGNRRPGLPRDGSLGRLARHRWQRTARDHNRDQAMSLQRRGTVRTVGENAGFSLVELMISLVLGLLVTAAAVGIFLSNQRTFRATESLARIQEDGRVAFELMARDLRQAAGNPCGRTLPMANVLSG